MKQDYLLTDNMKTYYTSYSLTHFFSGVKNRAELHDLRMLVYLDIKNVSKYIFIIYTFCQRFIERGYVNDTY